MPRIHASINPAVLRWARKTAGFDLEEAAKKIGVNLDRLHEWESGNRQPTVRQAREAARVFRRPFAVLFSPNVPQDAPSLADFRRMPDDAPRGYSTKLRFLIRELQHRQQWASELRELDEMEPLAWVGSLTTSQDHSQAATVMRGHFNGVSQAIEEVRSADEALSVWTDAVERIGVFVCQAGDVEPEEARGFCLPDLLAPFIMVNSKDSRGARVFTIIHELVHLFLGLGGVSNLELHGRHLPNVREVEQFCNAVAGLVLVPSERLRRAWDEEDVSTDNDDEVAESIARIASRFRVSREVIARRLLDSDRIGQALYRRLHGQYVREWREQRQRMRESEGGPPYYRRIASRLGRSFIETLLHARAEGRITTRDVASLAGVKMRHVPEIAAEAGSRYQLWRRSG